jgi:hypothetical protein
VQSTGHIQNNKIGSLHVLDIKCNKKSGETVTVSSSIGLAPLPTDNTADVKSVDSYLFPKP